MKKVAFIVALMLGLQTSAEPFDPNNPKFKSAKISGTLTAAVIDAGVLNVQGQETVAGSLFVAGGTTTNTLAVNSTSQFSGTATYSGYLLAASGNSLFPFGQIADGAAAIGIKKGNFASLTAGYDRFLEVDYRDNLTNVIARQFTTGQWQNVPATGTAGSGTGITANATAVITPFVHKVTVINTAMTAAATTDITVWTTPVNTRLVRITANVTTVFAGGALSAVTLGCGKSAGTSEYLVATSVLAAQTTIGDVQAEVGAGLLSASLADMGTPAAGIPGAIVISCRFTCTGANCNAATTGAVTFEIEGVTYP